MARVRKQPEKKTRKLPRPKVKQSRISKFYSSIKRLLGKILSPFSFLLKPFQTKFFKTIWRFLRKILLIDYISSSWTEVRKVEWPNRKETIKLTSAVFIFAIAFGIFVAVIDYGLDKLFKEVIL